MMDSVAMENNLIEFYKSDVTPLNIGKLYGEDFPVYPGEVVILQAPPKSMKTMLLQNWMCSFKVPTYFLEMEMSPRQIWKRFIQIEQGWTEEELAKNYANSDFKMANKFDWLNVDYQPCFAIELEKRISMLPIKPEIIITINFILVK